MAEQLAVRTRTQPGASGWVTPNIYDVLNPHLAAGEARHTKTADSQVGDRVRVRVNGQIELVTIATIEELRDGSGYNMTFFYGAGQRYEGFVAARDFDPAESEAAVPKADGRRRTMYEMGGETIHMPLPDGDDALVVKAAALPFKPGDRVQINEPGNPRKDPRVFTINSISRGLRGTVFLDVAHQGGSTMGIFPISHLTSA